MAGDACVCRRKSACGFAKDLALICRNRERAAFVKAGAIPGGPVAIKSRVMDLKSSIVALAMKVSTIRFTCPRAGRESMARGSTSSAGMMRI